MSDMEFEPIGGAMERRSFIKRMAVVAGAVSVPAIASLRLGGPGTETMAVGQTDGGSNSGGGSNTGGGSNVTTTTSTTTTTMPETTTTTSTTSTTSTTTTTTAPTTTTTTVDPTAVLPETD